MAIDPLLVAKAVDDFYSAYIDPSQRQQLDKYLCSFKTAFALDETVRVCFVLLSRSNSANAQYFGAHSLYDAIRCRWEEVVENVALTEQIKNFLVEALTSGAHVQSQSLTNKLSSSVALLALYSLPDVWATPVQDLTTTWAASPELLLRVLAELAAEFPNVHMSLTQRSVLKTELHRVSEDMIRILSTVLSSANSPSLLNAAVECVEQWLRLPGSNLRQWTPLISLVFAKVLDDCTALTNLFSILGANEELVNEDALVLHVVEYLCGHLGQKLLGELGANPQSEEVTALAESTCTLAEGVVPVLLRLSSQSTDCSLLSRLSQFFAALSSIPGRYPLRETVSDLPHIFWTRLREDICDMRKSDNAKARKVAEAVSPSYAAVLEGAIDKLAYAPDGEDITAEEKEQFESYRLNRSEVSVNAYTLVGAATLQFLNQESEKAAREGDILRAESCLYCWENVADYLSEKDYDHICKIIAVGSSMLGSAASSPSECRLACTLMRLFYALSHLVSSHSEAGRLELECVGMVLRQLEAPSVTEEALRTLVKIIDDRPQWLVEEEYGGQLLNRCFALFQDEGRGTKHRLSALKCIGVTLSLREPEQIMELLKNALEPYLAGIGEAAADEGGEARRNFQIGIFSCLFTSVHNRSRPEGDSICLLLRASAPLLLSILRGTRNAATADRVCDALRSACTNLPPSKMAEFYPVFEEAVALSLDFSPSAASSLGKSLALSSSSVAGESLAGTVSKWAAHFDAQFPSDGAEEWIGLLVQVLKKDWPRIVEPFPHLSSSILTSSISLVTKALSQSEDPNVVRLAAQLMATIVGKVQSHANEQGRKMLQERGAMIVQMVFRRLKIDLMRQTIDALAEVLFFFVQSFTTETRTVIGGEENGNTPMVSAMFREIGNLRNFKQMTLRLNLATRNGVPSI